MGAGVRMRTGHCVGSKVVCAELGSGLSNCSARAYNNTGSEGEAFLMVRAGSGRAVTVSVDARSRPSKRCTAEALTLRRGPAVPIYRTPKSARPPPAIAHTLTDCAA